MVIDEIQLTRHISQVKGIGFDIDFKVDNHVHGYKMVSYDY